ncbi:hypothetical protein AYO21_09867 [Fonsecaea monophora]|uniref:Uncharacterized protein n=1 Tax=Fonsecaea monophora TaxID=254056 RepID=A0A177EXD9_9EURO|nr:hypothetical protein AYO21_09867 [Fonsecaea monophora]KAH0848773.1 hypothetical protein FOPE_03179 [Fonsecaea pedrosoi]OAG35940.1 hypothetical protein AYO21_09867 [Fonsecaea monophora]
MAFHEAEHNVRGLAADNDENSPMLFEAPLFVSGDDDDTFHVKNQSLTEWQRRIVMERLTKACTIQCFLISVLHGKLNKTPESPSATLMVFKFRLDPIKHGRRLIRARIDIEFFAEDREDAVPTVLAVGLDDRWTIGPTADHEDVVKGGNVNFGVAGIPFVSIGVEASLSKTGGRDIHDATTITGGTHFGEGIDAGVPYSFTVPVLLERHHDKKFKACVHLAAKGNTRTTIEWMFNKIPVDDPVLFNPTVDRRGNMTEAKYTKDELGKWEHKMEQLTHVICRTVYRGAEREI